MNSLSSVDISFICLFDVIAIISSAFYLSDRSQRFYVGKVKKIEAIRGSSLLIRISLYTSIVMLNLTILKHSPLTLSVWQSDLTKIIAMFLGAIGISVFVLAKQTLGVNYTPCFKSYVPGSVVTKSVYRYIRHPIYLGNLLIFLGVFLGTGSLWVGSAFVAMFILYYFTAVLEEKTLAEAFPFYSDYLRQTGRFLPRFIFSKKLVIDTNS